MKKVTIKSKKSVINKTVGTGKFRSISQLVIFELSKNPELSYDKLTEKVKALKPKSKWQKTHYAWYKSAIKAGRVKAVKVHAPKIETKPRAKVAQHVG